MIELRFNKNNTKKEVLGAIKEALRGNEDVHVYYSAHEPEPEPVYECDYCKDTGEDPYRVIRQSHALCYGCRGCGEHIKYCHQPPCPKCKGDQ